jgi:hypothetical protein
MPIQFSSALRVLVAVAALAVLSSAAYADTGSIRLSVVKAGWFLGASGGSGTLVFKGKQYPLSIGGVSGGLVFGASATDFSGRVSNIRRPSDVAGVYGAVGAGAAVVGGARAITLRNEKGALLQLQGRQAGLMVNVDVSGMAISLQ